jgi:hypothetical protein
MISLGQTHITSVTLWGLALSGVIRHVGQMRLRTTTETRPMSADCCAVVGHSREDPQAEGIFNRLDLRQ